MNASEQPLVSVLTPVYNGEEYLAECIESVLAQSYTHWEHIILDNQSTDGTSEIARSYEERDPRIRVLETERFVNVWENHRIACRAVSPDAVYIKFVHADDWLFPACLTEMVDLAEANPGVGLVSAYRLDDTRVSLTGLPYDQNVFAGRDIARLNLITGRFVFGNPSSILLRAEAVRARDPYYDDARFPHHADTASCLDVLEDWDFGFVHQLLTYTRRHPDSLSTAAGRRNTYIAENLKMLKHYGPLHLDPEELEGCVERRLLSYHRNLARALLRSPTPDFWKYHTESLRELGHPVSYAKLLKGVLLNLAGTTPADVIRGIRGLVRRAPPLGRRSGERSTSTRSFQLAQGELQNQ